MSNILFPWSDNWWLEGNQAWLCGSEISALFCVDMSTLKCRTMVRIPECLIKEFRSYPYCIKYRNTVFCLPSMGTCIWYLEINTGKWEKIEIEDKQRTFCYMFSYKQNAHCIWMTEVNSGRLLELNLKKREIEKKYYIPKQEDQFFGQYVLTGEKIYGIQGKKIYCVDIVRHDVRIYEIPDVKANLYTICYDGLNFWISGYCKEIYVWNPERGIIKVITKFPKQFGICLFQKNNVPITDVSSFFSKNEAFFAESICLGNYIWYIPGQSNEIIYIDKEEYTVHILESEIEQDCIKSQYSLPAQYAVQYVREDRYIGLYSFKMCCLLEIDTYELSIEYKDYTLSYEVETAIMEAYFQENDILQEGKMCNLKHFLQVLKNNSVKTENVCFNVGDNIYHMIGQ